MRDSLRFIQQGEEENAHDTLLCIDEQSDWFSQRPDQAPLIHAIPRARSGHAGAGFLLCSLASPPAVPVHRKQCAAMATKRPGEYQVGRGSCCASPRTTAGAGISPSASLSPQGLLVARAPRGRIAGGNLLVDGLGPASSRMITPLPRPRFHSLAAVSTHHRRTCPAFMAASIRMSRLQSRPAVPSVSPARSSTNLRPLPTYPGTGSVIAS